MTTEDVRLTRMKLEPIAVERWLTISHYKYVNDRLKLRETDVTCAPMHCDFRKRARGQVCWRTILTALHVVYAWMPTMLWRNGSPEPLRRNNKKWREKRVDDLNLVLHFRKNSIPSHDEIESLIELTNNSVVGLSKMLYLFDPASFPIWDSRVCKKFFKGNKSRQGIGHQITWYRSWLKESRSWLGDPRVIRRIGQLQRKYVWLKGVRPLRVVEIVLFKAAGK